eukprot:5452623-Pleurochrysis_carterae.AAC.2
MYLCGIVASGSRPAKTRTERSATSVGACMCVWRAGRRLPITPRKGEHEEGARAPHSYSLPSGASGRRPALQRHCTAGVASDGQPLSPCYILTCKNSH